VGAQHLADVEDLVGADRRRLGEAAGRIRRRPWRTWSTTTKVTPQCAQETCTVNIGSSSLTRLSSQPSSDR
jgi:hypothetical protein